MWRRLAGPVRCGARCVSPSNPSPPLPSWPVPPSSSTTLLPLFGAPVSSPSLPPSLPGPRRVRTVASRCRCVWFASIASRRAFWFWPRARSPAARDRPVSHGAFALPFFFFLLLLSLRQLAAFRGLVASFPKGKFGSNESFLSASAVLLSAFVSHPFGGHLHFYYVFLALFEKGRSFGVRVTRCLVRANCV